MDKKRNLSTNLKAFQEARSSSLAEFAAELEIPKSTLQSVMQEGNTTLDTALRISESLCVPLDVLLENEQIPEQLGIARRLLQEADWLASTPEEKREKIIFHIEGILEALR